MKLRSIPTLLAFLAVLAIPVLAEEGSAPKDSTKKIPTGPQPKLTLASMDHDFGKLKPGTPLEFRFEVKNEGKADLIIEKVKASCGCTTAAFDTLVAPGKTGGITLQVKKTDTYKGKVSKGATVTTNDPDHESFRLNLTAEFDTTLTSAGH